MECVLSDGFVKENRQLEGLILSSHQQRSNLVNSGTFLTFRTASRMFIDTGTKKPPVDSLCYKTITWRFIFTDCCRSWDGGILETVNWQSLSAGVFHKLLVDWIE